MKLALAREFKNDILERVQQAPPASRATRALAAPAGVAVGLAPGGDGEFRVAVRATTARALAQPALVELLERAADEIDVRLIGTVFALAARRERSPVVPGASIGHPAVTAGTLGCLVADPDHRVGVLSNNHVLADTDRAAIGDPILSPGPLDGGGPDDRIGRLRAFVPLSVRRNEVDAAVALLDAVADGADNRVDGVRLTAPLDDDEIADLVGVTDQVRKHGRTTGLTAGTVTAVELDGVAVGYDTGTFVFDRNIEIQGTRGAPFSRGGDSGSVVHTRQGHGVGLLYAGSELPEDCGGTTYANPLHLALSALGVRLL